MNTFDDIMQERHDGRMHVPYEARHPDGRWRRYSRTLPGVRTYRQARQHQAAWAARMTGWGYPERMGWSEESR